MAAEFDINKLPSHERGKEVDDQVPDSREIWRQLGHCGRDNRSQACSRTFRPTETTS